MTRSFYIDVNVIRRVRPAAPSAGRRRPRRPSSATARGRTASSWRRAAGGRRCSTSCATLDRPPHIGVLLDNVPDYLFWLAAAALSGAVVVGINSTYRGDQLGSADRPHRLPAARHPSDLAGAARRRRHRRRPTIGVLVDRRPGLRGRRVAAPPIAVRRRRRDRRRPLPPDLHVGLDRACPRRCGAPRAGSPAPGAHVAGIAELDRRRRRLRAAAVLPLQRRCSRAGRRRSTPASRSRPRPRFSASSTLPDIRRFGATCSPTPARS